MLQSTMNGREPRITRGLVLHQVCFVPLNADEKKNDLVQCFTHMVVFLFAESLSMFWTSFQNPATKPTHISVCSRDTNLPNLASVLHKRVKDAHAHMFLWGDKKEHPGNNQHGNYTKRPSTSGLSRLVLPRSRTGAGAGAVVR